MSVDRASDPDSPLQIRRLRRENKRLRYELGVSVRQVPHLRYMIESCPDGLALLAGDGTILEHNTAMAKLLGDATSLLLDESLPQLVQDQLRSPRSELVLSPERLANALSESETVLVELQESVVEFRLSGWVDSDGGRFVVAARPMDSRDSQARQLLQARQRIQALDEALQDQRREDEAARLDSLAILASTMVHDLNNALSVVLSNIQLMREELGEGPQTELLDDACIGTTRVQELVNRLRGFSMGPSLVLRELCLSTWLPEFLRPIVAGQRASLDLQFAPEKVWVAADENQLAQVFLNLVTNGTQAARGADIAPEITVKMAVLPHGYISGEVVRPVAETGAPHVIVTVEDNGPGIPHERLGRLFTPFQTSKPNGSGLGLASVARIASLHRGGIAVENVPEGGARFTLALPIAPGCTSKLGPAEPQSSTDSSDLLVGAEVILMDDDLRVRRGLKRILASAGAVVTETACGEELIAAYGAKRAQGSVPVCIVDIHVDPGMGGIPTIRQLIQQWPDVVAMACTGHAQVASTEEFKLLGFRDWIFKPFDADALRRAVEGLVAATK